MSIEEKQIDPIAFSHQEEFNYCGPACSQMFLSHFEITNTQQDTAYEEIQKLNTENDPVAFYSSPEGLGSYLNKLTPDKIDAFASDTLQGNLDRIYHTISFEKIPCVSLVNSGAHWTVIDGIRFNEVADGKIEITAVHYLDPSDNSPSEGYKFMAALQQQFFLANTYGNKWKNKLVILSKKTDEKFKPIQTEAKTLTIPGGGTGNPIDIALANLNIYGFNDIRKIPDIGGGAPVTEPIFITGLDRASNFTIVPLDATSTQEFQDFIYVAIEEGTNTLLEAANFTKVLQIDNDQEMESKLREKFPGESFEIIPGYFWKQCFELRSRLSVARRFRLGDKEMFLLPNGNVSDLLTESLVGGG
ncbi:C39 family peptidase [Pleurocapsa sp. PCC 7319]|uniref:C39 family peptidase n=1 Tax=Pleurocapsa sp. PCC 7319 TaxID=118161 RepID=UPI0003477A9F|nr:C39 family peptidase [Pleurocapsa sp. PCC 7319]